jgi:hypothetical protein
MFVPDGRISRAELIKLIVASLGLELQPEYDGSRFADWGGVAQWAVPYVGAAARAGIVKGSSEGGKLYLDADARVTRQEMVAMAVRSITGAGAGAGIVGSATDIVGSAADIGGSAADIGGSAAGIAIDPEDVVDFTSADAWARQTLESALRYGIVDVIGAEAAQRNPSAPPYLVTPLAFATRAEAAHTLYKLLSLR